MKYKLEGFHGNKWCNIGNRPGEPTTYDSPTEAWYALLRMTVSVDPSTLEPFDGTEWIMYATRCVLA